MSSRGLIVIALLALATSLPGQVPATGSLMQREVQRAIDRMGATAEFETRVKDAASPEAGLQMGMDLAHHGIGLLDAPTLLLRAQVLQQILAKADEGTCAAWSRGTLDATRAEGLFNAMDSVTTSQWGEVSAKAMMAQIRATSPATPPTQDEALAALYMVKTVMTATDKAKYEELLPRLGTASDAEMCWFGKGVYGNALKLPVAQRDSALRTFARLEAQ